MTAIIDPVRLGAVLLVACVGCYSPSIPTGVPCTPPPEGTGTCPGEQTCELVAGTYQCVDEVPDVPIVDAPADVSLEATDDDPDADGVSGPDDNCPVVANPNQANEDGDAMGDACDPCPPYSDAMPVVDPDGDGVAGACDPWPTVAGDRIVRFAGFADGIPTGWTAVGAWTAANGELAITVADNEIATFTFPQPAGTRAAVFAAAIVDDIRNVSARSLSVVQMNAGPTDTVYCGLLRAGAGPKLTLLDYVDGAATTIGDADSSFEAGVAPMFVHARDGAAYSCEDGTAQVTGAIETTRANAGIGVRTNSVTARFRWILVVGN